MVNREKLLSIAFQEERLRRVSIFEEINKLLGIVQKWYNENVGINSSAESIKAKTLNALDYDIAMISKVNKFFNGKPHLQNKATFALKTNKNFEIFKCAKSLVIADFDRMVSNSFWGKYPVNPNIITVLGGSAGDFKGTSLLNCLQAGLFTILYANKEVNNLIHIREFIINNIYNVDHSPTIQTTKLPKNLNHTAIDPKFKQWIYYYKDHISPQQGELIFFTLGYSFGGSREDSRYNNKLLRAEDCSSSIAKWINASLPFSTLHMEELFEQSCRSKECKSASLILSPKSQELNSVNEGDVFVFRTYDLEQDPNKLNKLNAKGGHTGVVTNLYKQENCFENLSYSREMPDIEGLGISKYCIDSHPQRKYMFFSLHDLDMNELHKDVIEMDYAHNEL